MMLFGALPLHRLSARLSRRSIPVLPGALRELIRLLHRAHLSADAVFDPGAELGYGGIGVVVERGVRVGSGSLVCQNATLEPNVTVGRDVLVGVGAVVRAGVTLGDGAQVGANAVVETDVAPGVKVAGVPARPVGGGPT